MALPYLFGDGGLVLAGTAQGSGFSVPSAPIVLQPLRKSLASVLGGQPFRQPGSGHRVDLLQLVMSVSTSASSGTNPTLLTKLQYTNDLLSGNTTTTAALTAAATSLPVTLLDGIVQNGFVVLYDTDGSGYEWVQVTSSNATGAGSATIVRGQLGTTARAFNSGAVVGFTLWQDIPTPNATTTTLTTGALAPAATPATVDTGALGMTSLAAYPIIRVLTTVGGTSTPTVTHKVSLSGRIATTSLIQAA